MDDEHFGWPKYILNPDVYHSPDEQAEYAKVVAKRRMSYEQVRAKEREVGRARRLAEAKATTESMIKELARRPAPKISHGRPSYMQIALMEWELGLGDKDHYEHYRAVKDGMELDKATADAEWKEFRMKVKTATFAVALIIGLFLTMVIVG